MWEVMGRDQVVIVTGGATGIGRGISEKLAAEGARVAIVQPSIEEAAAAASRIAGARGFAADIADPERAFAAMDDVLAAFGRIDALVNNASITGAPALASFLDAPVEHVHRVVDVNLKGTWWCSQAAARAMVRQGRGGAIVHISSVGAFTSQELAGAYCATKAAVVSLARSMALELARYDIRVNAVAPGDIATAANVDIREEAAARGAVRGSARTTPLGRRGTPADVASAVSFLLGPEAAFITGTVLTVDGGWLTC